MKLMRRIARMQSWVGFFLAMLSLGLAAVAFAADCNEAASLAREAAKMASRNSSGAQSRLEKAEMLCPRSAALSFNLAMVYYDRGLLSEARSQLEKTLKKDPNHTDALNNLAYLMITDGEGDQARALQLAQRAVTLEPNNRSYRDTLAKAQVPKYPAILNMQVNLADANGNKVLEAGESGSLQVTVTNTGKGEGQNVQISPEAESRIPGLRLAGAQTLSSIGPGQSRTIDFSITTEEAELTNDTLTIRVNAQEQNGFAPDPMLITMTTKAYDPPKLTVADIGIADQSENGQIEPMEIVEITARIFNSGRGDARGVTARVIIGKDVFPAGDTQTEFTIGSLPAGQYHDITFAVFASKKATDIPISIALTEERSKHNAEQKLDLAFNRPEKKSPQKIVLSADLPLNSAPWQVAAPGLSVDVDIPPKTGQVKPDAVAVVIGNKDYAHQGVPQVEFAIRDASVIRQYLIDTLGFADHNIIFQQNATKTDFLKIFGDKDDYRGELYSRTRKGKSDVFIFYSGHGAPDTITKRVFLLPAEADPSSIKFTAYSLDLLYANLNRLGEEKDIRSLTMVFDACFSGMSNDGAAVVSDASSIGIRPKLPVLALPNTAIITSSSDDQISSWYREKRHGLFTYFFLKGIKNTVAQGKPVTLGDIRASLTDVDSVNDYAYRLYKREQTPTIIGDLGMVLVEKK
ncbi:MAG: caspase family protein [Proteobacteria bacterium]|nr:caspase family protein [Pseudomonadota bacterium]MBU1686484.1 caspase family protein [Pseudomonadota bacterium]